MGTKVVKTTDDTIFTADELAEKFGLLPYTDPENKYPKRRCAGDDGNGIEEHAMFAFAYARGWEQGAGDGFYRKCEACDGDGYTYDHMDNMQTCDQCEDGRIDIEWSEYQDTPEYEKCLSEAQDEHYSNWLKSVEAAWDKYLRYFYLVTEPVLIQRDGWQEKGYRLTPEKDKTWKDVCQEIVETINGVGMFWFDSALDLLQTGPYKSYKEAASRHFHHMKHYGAVYGVTSIEDLYYDWSRHYFYSW